MAGPVRTYTGFGGPSKPPTNSGGGIELETETVTIDFTDDGAGQDFASGGDGSYTVDGESISIINSSVAETLRTTASPGNLEYHSAGTEVIYQGTRTAPMIVWDFESSLSSPLAYGDLVRVSLTFTDKDYNGVTQFPDFKLLCYPNGYTDKNSTTMAMGYGGASPTTVFNFITQFYPDNDAADTTFGSTARTGTSTTSPLVAEYAVGIGRIWDGGATFGAADQAREATLDGVVGFACKKTPSAVVIQSISVTVLRGYYSLGGT